MMSAGLQSGSFEIIKGCLPKVASAAKIISIFGHFLQIDV
jgi:hypothetical protein